MNTSGTATAQRGTTVTAPRGTTAAVVAVIGAWCAVMLLSPDRDVARLLSVAGLVALSALAGAAAVLRGGRERGVARRSWWFLGAGQLSWACGQGVWWWQAQIAGGPEGSPSSGVAALALQPLVVLAVLSLPLGTASAAGRLRGVLDGMILAASLALCCWTLLLRPLVGTDHATTTELLAGLSSPVSDVVVISAVLHALIRAQRQRLRLPLPLGRVGAGLLALAVADAFHSAATTRGAHVAGGVADLGWFVGFTLLLLAAARRTAPGRWGAAPRRGARLLGDLGSAAPNAAVVLVVVVTTADVLQHAVVDAVSFWWRTALILLLVGRQVVSLHENHALTRHLERRVAERTAELRAGEQRFEALVHHSSDLVTVVDAQGVVGYQSDASEQVLGRPARDLVGRPLTDLMDVKAAGDLLDALQRVAAEELATVQLRSVLQHAGGRECVVAMTITNLLGDPAVRGLVLNTRDVTEQVRLEEQLTTQAFTDSLTGLHNRALFNDRLAHALSRRTGPDAALAVFFLDLDGFKAVNDTLGHTRGDALLVAVALRLRSLVRPSDTIARLGGDEFAVLADELAAAGDELALAERIAAGLREPFEVDGEVVRVAASVGIATLDSLPENADELLRNADLAMYAAKAERAGGCAVYHPGLHAGLVERVRFEADLRLAVEEEQFFLQYQPMIDIVDGRITGVEALVRWRHPERGVVPPDQFIPLAESTGLIRPLGLWVLREACRQAVEWDRTRGSAVPLRMSVNLSVHQVQEPGIVATVAAVLAETGFPARRLTLEMTESVLAEDGDQVLAVLAELRGTGIKLAIDDFGTGYSSLSYLQRFPFDTLKIDRSFIGRMSQSGDAALVDSIIGMARSMSLETVAEGIEEPHQLMTLQQQGCTTGQGYHFSPPVAAEAIEGMLVAERAATTAAAGRRVGRVSLAPVE